MTCSIGGKLNASTGLRVFWIIEEQWCAKIGNGSKCSIIGINNVKHFILCSYHVYSYTATTELFMKVVIWTFLNNC